MSTHAATVAAATQAAATQATTRAAGAGVAGPTSGQMVLVLGFFLGVAAVITVAAHFLGAFRRSVQGPPRVPPDQPVWPSAVSLLSAAVAFVVAATAVLSVIGFPGAPLDVGEAVEPPTGEVIPAADDADPTPADMVESMRLTAIVYTAAAGAALLSLWSLRRTVGGATVGLRVRQLPSGLVVGILALVVVLPWMLTGAVLLQLVRLALGYEPDAMHQILEALRDDPQPRTIAWVLVSAVVVAPIAEEVLFRGFLQTALVYGLPRLRGRGAEDHPSSPDDEVARELPLIGEPNLSPPFQLPTHVVVAPPGGDFAHRTVAHDLAYARTPPAPAATRRFDPPARWRWLGIILTSAVFASLHEAWSIPLIFLLSLFFGYVYERTANLWAVIVMHFGFNAVNTLFVLLSLWLT